MIRLTFAPVAAAITSQAGPPPAPADEGRAYFEALYRDRAAITGGLVEYTVSTERDGVNEFLDGSTLPARMTTRAPKRGSNGRPVPDLRVEVDSEVVAWANDRGEKFAYPRSLRFRGFNQGRLETVATVSVTKANFNVPVDPALLTWKALNPKVWVLLNANNVGKISPTEAVTWDGDRFKLGPVPPLLMPPSAAEGGEETSPVSPVSASSTAWPRIFLGAGLVFAVALLAVEVPRRR